MTSHEETSLGSLSKTTSALLVSRLKRWQAEMCFVYLDFPPRTRQRGLCSFHVWGGSCWALEVFTSSLIRREPIAAVLLKGKCIRWFGETHLVTWGSESQEELGQWQCFSVSSLLGALTYLLRCFQFKVGVKIFKMTCFPLYLLHTGELVFIKVTHLAGTNEWHIKGLSSFIKLHFQIDPFLHILYVSPYLSEAKSGKMKERTGVIGCRRRRALSPWGFTTRGEIEMTVGHLHRVQT